MLYELRLTIYVEQEDDLVDVRDKLEDLKPQLKVINPCEENQEFSVIDLLQNRHDESPNAPCTILDHWNNCPECP